MYQLCVSLPPFVKRETGTLVSAGVTRLHPFQLPQGRQLQLRKEEKKISINTEKQPVLLAKNPPDDG